MVWLISLPLVMYQFHIVTPIAILINTLLWIPITIALLFGFGVIFFGWWLPPLAKLCGAVCDGGL